MISIIALSVLFSLQSGANAENEIYYGTPTVTETIEPSANPPFYIKSTAAESTTVKPTLLSTDPPAYIIMSTATESTSVEATLFSTYAPTYIIMTTTAKSTSVEPTLLSTDPLTYMMTTTAKSTIVKHSLVPTDPPTYDISKTTVSTRVDPSLVYSSERRVSAVTMAVDPGRSEIVSLRYTGEDLPTETSDNNFYSNSASDMIFGIFSFALVVFNI